MRERAAPEVDVDLVEGQALALVDGQRPGEPQRELLEGAGDRLDDLLLGLIVGVAAALPRDRLDLVLVAVDLDPDALFLEPRDAGDGAVDPAPVGIVAQQDDLGAGLQRRASRRSAGRTLVEVAGHARLVGLRGARAAPRDRPC